MAWTKVKIAGAAGIAMLLATGTATVVIERENAPFGLGSFWQSDPPHTWYDDMQRPLFTQDGKHVAFAARKADKSRVVVDGQEGAEYDSDIHTLVLTANGQHPLMRSNRAGNGGWWWTGRRARSMTTSPRPSYSAPTANG